jgi:hypothetical protein
MAGPALAVGVGLSAYGQYKEGKQQEKISEYNAAELEKRAKQEKVRAEYDEAAHRKRIQSVLSSQKAYQGTTGVDSPAHLASLQETAIEGEMDALAIRYGGDVAASRAKSEAQIERYRGRSARQTSLLRTGATLLTGGSMLARRQPLPTGNA